MISLKSDDLARKTMNCNRLLCVLLFLISVLISVLTIQAVLEGARYCEVATAEEIQELLLSGCC